MASGDAGSLLRKSSVAGIAVLNFLMLCPALVAIGLQQFVYREPIAQPLALLFRPTRWFLVAWVLPPVVMLAALGVSLLLPTAIYSGDTSGLPPEMASFKQQVVGLGVAPIVGMVVGRDTGLAGWRSMLSRGTLPADV
ncbi:MAG TPA: hypothetical protein VGM06_17005 [Polyangiaceae bacterium]